jgi:hypothetical protein
MGSKSYSKGISWIDDCRIPFVDNVNFDLKPNRSKKVYGGNSLLDSKTEYTNTDYNTQGRFPANLLVSDDMLNDGVISKSGDIKPHIQKRKTNVFNSNQIISSFKSDKGTNSRYYDIDNWFDNLIDV